MTKKMNVKFFIIIFACLCCALGCHKHCHFHHCTDGSCFCYSGTRLMVEKKISEDEQGTIFIQLKDAFYRVKLQGDPCNFETYDKNRDGIISLGELVDIFGIDMITKDVFKDLDVLKDDGAVTPEEFDANVGLIVPVCNH